MAARKPAALQLQASLSLASKAGTLAGAQRIELLEAIGKTGSITRAAKAVGLSYKGAWDAVEAMNNMADAALVERIAGGRGGGGTQLTPRGVALVESYRAAAEEHLLFVEALNRRLKDRRGDLQLLGRLAMKTSARNQLWGRVVRIAAGAVNDEVELEIKGGDRIVAVITHQSVEQLGLKTGSDAVALIKASWVILGVDDTGPTLKLSTRNQLRGSVKALTPGAVNTEVTVDLKGGNTLAAIVTNTSAQSLALKPGIAVTALFKASSVIIGVAG
ncbi:MAG: LysR family transcriptional regulator [Hydrocarboniphaga sp.]|uniref:TOBE domain-containing protein n=1 Tax=Hydrocarboniphaga sp. TaxID=2033016 RepID=UPI00262424BA|nr:TOBE domain-containing protein [Hydrocarboniphaga sp.]MDB5969616.1 LysR family transcriptional regulator [Hydrocarboniphaga sp.]